MVLARAAVRLLYTQEPAPKEDDSCAWAPASEIEPSVLAGVNRRGGSPSLHPETDAQGA
jgi:hypothetical protein